ncbi:hypothetical protein IWW45_005187, partial [Coemansia sp. RSA 485]
APEAPAADQQVYSSSEVEAETYVPAPVYSAAAEASSSDVAPASTAAAPAPGYSAVADYTDANVEAKCIPRPKYRL